MNKQLTITIPRYPGSPVPKSIIDIFAQHNYIAEENGTITPATGYLHAEDIDFLLSMTGFTPGTSISFYSDTNTPMMMTATPTHKVFSVIRDASLLPKTTQPSTNTTPNPTTSNEEEFLSEFANQEDFTQQQQTLDRITFVSVVAAALIACVGVVASIGNIVNNNYPTWQQSLSPAFSAAIGVFVITAVLLAIVVVKGKKLPGN